MNTLGERKLHPPKDAKISMICYLYRLVCIYLFVAATEIRVGCGTSCRNGRSRRAIFPISRMTALRPSLLNSVVPATGPEHLLEILLFSEPDISSKAIEGMYFIVVNLG